MAYVQLAVQSVINNVINDYILACEMKKAYHQMKINLLYEAGFDYQ